MEIPKEIIKEPFLGALVALEGKQGSNFFNSRLHGKLMVSKSKISAR
jgi:hypothetical protein